MLVPLDENLDPIQHIVDLARLLSAAAASLASMADPLSIAASVTGILAFTAATARSLATLVLEIRDAPDDISVLARDVKSLAAVLITAQDLCVRHGIGDDDKALAAALMEYLEVCQESMQGLRLLLKPFASPSGGGRRSPVRFVLGWTMKKGEVRALRSRLNEGKASLNLTLSALNGVLEGKGQEDIRADISKAFLQLTSDFRNLEAGIKVKNRVADDAVSVSTRRGRRPSMSTATDAGFAMRRYIEQTEAVKSPPDEEEAVEVTVSSHISTPPTTFLSPWTGEPAAIFDAVRSRNIPLVRSLIAQGASLSARMGQGYGSTVLHHCAVADDAEMAALLADHGADINAKDNDFRSPLQLALVSESLLVARLLVERGCVISDTVPALLRLMSRAEGTGMDALARALHGRLSSTTRGPFLVHVAISENTPVALATLLDAGFSATRPNERGLSPLFHTLFEDKRPLIRILVEHGADPGEYVSREVLIEAGLPTSWYRTELAVDLPRWTPLLLASHCMRHGPIMTTLLDLGADPDQPIGQDDRSTALTTVCDRAYAAQAPILVRRGVRLRATTRDDRGPMYWAALCCHVALLRCMIEHGGDVDYQCRHDGETVLMIAARKDQFEMVKLLLASRADVSLRNLEGMTALDVARRMGHGEVAALLEGAQASGHAAGV